MNVLADLVTCVPTDVVDGLRDRLVEEGYLVMNLDGADVVDKQSLLAAVERDLPGEGSLRPHNWDALRDVIRRNIASTGSDQVAVVWTSADQMEQRGLQDFLVAVEIFTEVLRSRYEERPDGRFHIVLAGDAPNFQR